MLLIYISKILKSVPRIVFCAGSQTLIFRVVGEEVGLGGGGVLGKKASGYT